MVRIHASLEYGPFKDDVGKCFSVSRRWQRVTLGTAWGVQPRWLYEKQLKAPSLLHPFSILCSPFPQTAHTGHSQGRLSQATPTDLSHRPLPQTSLTDYSYRPHSQVTPIDLSHRPHPLTTPADIWYTVGLFLRQGLPGFYLSLQKEIFWSFTTKISDIFMTIRLHTHRNVCVTYSFYVFFKHCITYIKHVYLMISETEYLWFIL